MHYHCEVIMPPTDDVEGQLKNIMAPFDENADEEIRSHAFWDFYVIGGRWAGEHLRALVDADKLSEFYAELDKRKVTVSGFRCGKEELQPADQIPMVDELWREMFPESELKACPLFQHFNNQYEDNCLDVDTFDNITEHLTASHLIIGGLDYQDKKYEAKFILEKQVWNGCNLVDTTWDGNVLKGVEMYAKDIKGSKDEYREKNTIRDDWLVATVDYHS